MNKELLNKLIGQSWEDHESGLVMFDREKFAEMIVQECVDVITKECHEQSSQGIISNLMGLNQARFLINEHFNFIEKDKNNEE